MLTNITLKHTRGLSARKKVRNVILNRERPKVSKDEKAGRKKSESQFVHHKIIFRTLLTFPTFRTAAKLNFARHLLYRIRCVSLVYYKS